MHFTGEITMDYRVYRRVAATVNRPLLWSLRIFGALVVACNGVVVAYGGVSGGIVVSTLMGLAFVFLSEIVVVRSWARVRRLTGTPWRYEIGPDSIVIQTPETTMSMLWSGISKARIKRHRWTLRARVTRQWIPIPRAAFSATEQEQIDQLVKERRAGLLAFLPPIGRP